MTKSIDLISNIEEKVILLLTQQEQQRKEGRKLQERIVELQNLLSEKNLIISKLEQEKQIKSNTLSSEKGREKAELQEKINDLLKEVDKCMEMLIPE